MILKKTPILNSRPIGLYGVTCLNDMLIFFCFTDLRLEELVIYLNSI